MRMTEQQFKQWMTAKTRQYIWLILRTDPNRVKISFLSKFHWRFKHSHGICGSQPRRIWYRTDYIKNGWDCDEKALENLVIHEVCHLKYSGHDNVFFNEYKRWSGDDFISRWHNGIADNGKYVSNVVGLPNL